MSLFKNGTGNADKLPMDVPIGPDYVLGPGDGLVMDISGGAPQRLQAAVDPEGRVDLPEGGTLMVSGLSLSAAERAIEAGAQPPLQQSQGCALAVAPAHHPRLCRGRRRAPRRL